MGIRTEETTIDGRVYAVTTIPARRGLRLFPLVQRGIEDLSGDEIAQLTQGLLEGLCKVDGQDLWPIYDAHFAGDMPAQLKLLAFALEVSFGFQRAARVAAQPASPSPG